MSARNAVLLATIALTTVSGCGRERLAPLTAPRLAIPAVGSGEAAAAPPESDVVEPDDRRIAVQIAQLTAGTDARVLDAVSPIEGGALLLTRESDASSLRWSSFVLRDGQRGPAWPVDTAREPAPSSAAVAPITVALPGGPIFILEPSANLGREGERASLAIRVVRPDGRIDDESRWLPLDERVTFDGAWSAAAAGDVAVVCFAGRGDGTTEADVALGPVRDLFCGTLDRRGGWAHPPSRVFAAGAEGDRSWTVRALAVGSGTEDTVMIAVFVAGHDYDRVVGIQLDTATWYYSVPLDLGAPRVLDPATFAWRRPPQILTTAGGTAYALPGTGLTTPFAGWLGIDGQRPGDVLTIAELGPLAERTVLVDVEGVPALIYDLPGVSATRTVVAFDGQAPFLADLERVSGMVEHNGPAGGGLVSVVVDLPDGAELWVVDAETLGGAREPGRSLRSAERVRLPEPRFDDAGAPAPTTDAGQGDAIR
jgi:hypothetical protein